MSDNLNISQLKHIIINKINKFKKYQLFKILQYITTNKYAGTLPNSPTLPNSTNSTNSTNSSTLPNSTISPNNPDYLTQFYDLPIHITNSIIQSLPIYNTIQLSKTSKYFNNLSSHIIHKFKKASTLLNSFYNSKDSLYTLSQIYILTKGEIKQNITSPFNPHDAYALSLQYFLDSFANDDYAPTFYETSIHIAFIGLFKNKNNPLFDYNHSASHNICNQPIPFIDDTIYFEHYDHFNDLYDYNKIIIQKYILDIIYFIYFIANISDSFIIYTLSPNYININQLQSIFYIFFNIFKLFNKNISFFIGNNKLQNINFNSQFTYYNVSFLKQSPLLIPTIIPNLKFILKIDKSISQINIDFFSIYNINDTSDIIAWKFMNNLKKYGIILHKDYIQIKQFYYELNNSFEIVKYYNLQDKKTQIIYKRKRTYNYDPINLQNILNNFGVDPNLLGCELINRKKIPTISIYKADNQISTEFICSYLNFYYYDQNFYNYKAYNKAYYLQHNFI